MKIVKLNELITEVTEEIYNSFIDDSKMIIIKYNDENLDGDYSKLFRHKGLYCFLIQKNNEEAIAYIGKCENGDRIRQHLTGKNKKNGKKLAVSVKTKNENIMNAIKKKFTIKMSLYPGDDFQEPSLSCIELALIIKAKKDFSLAFSDEKFWNQRIG